MDSRRCSALHAVWVLPRAGGKEMMAAIDRGRSFGTVFVSVAVLGLLFLPLVARAVPTVTYTEILDDINDKGEFGAGGLFLDLERNLERTRVLGDGTIQHESDDATIASQNNINITGNFGFSTTAPIVYSHAFVGVPPIEQFLRASLTLNVFSVSGTPTGEGQRRPKLSRSELERIAAYWSHN